ncbi:PH domain-containing protein [Corynebacterium sp. sy017]|uniref:PH domain-containing protein n=1 Tax=unclassified Corynebacterium TaxID=2624378 RepID=UPI00118533EB|nr:MULTISPECIES: PH domain-containing protein [unclassified Corynebacterium]MBP3089052.1 PH domain-containing protein [Corynebacterium sp. sy017]TSD91370.1 PH domain-containing protein [Corynebacterium sp. SY003]
MSSSPTDHTDKALPNQKAVFAPDRTHLLSAGLVAGILFLISGANPALLSWLIIFPIIFAIWVLRARTVVSETGIDTRYLFSSSKHLPWSELKGVGFHGAKAFAESNSGQKISLPGISFNSLPVLEQASQGRIPDALTQGRMAANEKVRIVRRDGHEVLVSQEEYAQWQAQQAQQEKQKKS